jgi:hypothetical protein
MNIDEFSDAMMGPVLADMPPIERKKMLLLQREMCSSVAYGWIDRQLALLNDVAVDSDWVAAVKSDPKIPEIRAKFIRYWAQQQDTGEGSHGR